MQPGQKKLTRLKDTPEDGISSICFHPSQNKLLVSSWDKSLRLYDVEANKNVMKCGQKAAILDCKFFGERKCVSGGLQKRLIMTDLEKQVDNVFGMHSDTVRCLETSTEVNAIYSGGWDKTVRVWDTRKSEPQVHCRSIEGKVYAMAKSSYSLVVATSERKNLIFDLRKMNSAVDVRESGLRKQTRCVKSNPDSKSFAYGSIEGRISIEYFDWKEKAKGYAFKCHRVVDKTTNTCWVYPVNSLAFHPIHYTFASGGSDGNVNVWDGYNKKRICQLCTLDTGISSMDFNFDGSLLAIAASYLWENGEPKEKKQNYIEIRTITENEVKRKTSNNLK